MSKIVVIGHAGMKLSIPPYEPPDPGNYSTIGPVGFVAGGSAVTTAITLERLGVATVFVGTLGEDVIGHRIREKLGAEGVDVSRLHLCDDHTSPTLVVQSTSEGEPRFLYHPGSALEDRSYKDIERISCSVVHLAAPELLHGLWPNGILDMVRRLKTARRTVSLDTCVAAHGCHDHAKVVKEHRYLLELVDIVFTTAEDARLISGRVERESMVNYFHHRNVKVVVIKFNPEQALVSWQGGLQEASVANPEIVDTFGASESCTAGYLAGYLRSLDPLHCTRLGLTISGLCTRHKGDLTGTANRQLVEKVMEGVIAEATPAT